MTVLDMLIKLAKLYYKIFIWLLFLLFLSQTELFSEDEIAVEIDNPKFSEKGLDNRLYEIKAERGIQKKDSLQLFNVEGKLRNDSGLWIYLNAESGNFNQLTNNIELRGKIKFYTDDNDNFYSDYAQFSIDSDSVEFNKNIRYVRGMNIITADESNMKNDFNHIVYKGNVSTLYVLD